MRSFKKYLKKEHTYLVTGFVIACTLFTTNVVNADYELIDDIENINLLEVKVDSSLNFFIPKNDSFTAASLPKVGVEVIDYDTNPYEKVLYSSAVPDGEGVCNSDNFTGMSYKKVTNVRSKQYALLNSPECYTDKASGIRMIGDRYCIAIGSFYCTTIGTKINLIMESGEVVKCIMGEAKADEHTDETHRYQKWDGSVAEFVFDPDVFTSVKNYPKEAEGRIARIEVVE